MFQGASEKLKNQDPIRVTNHKDPVSEETRAVLKNTKVWRMENEFYNFARKIFEQVTLNFISYNNYKLRNMQILSKTAKLRVKATSTRKFTAHRAKLLNRL